MSLRIQEGMTVDRFRLVKLLGVGGNGQVFRAVDESLGRVVAIKFLNQGFRQSDQIRKRFLLEGQTMATLQHPNIARVFSIGIYANIPYIVLEYIEGFTLSHYLAGNSLTADQLLDVFCQICDAMTSVHSQGIVHRDLKPNNIMLVGEDRPTAKVLDFGLCRLTESRQDLTETQTGALVGTVHYMSPEQCRGEKATEASDVYALGCMLYEAVTGEPPFTADNAVGVIFQHTRERPEAPSRRAKVPLLPGFESVCLKALEKRLDDRYSSCALLKHDLELVRQKRPSEIHARSITGMQPPNMVIWRRVSIAVGICLLLLVPSIFFVPGVSAAVLPVLGLLNRDESVDSALWMANWYGERGLIDDGNRMLDYVDAINADGLPPMYKAASLALRGWLKSQQGPDFAREAVRLSQDAVCTAYLKFKTKGAEPYLRYVGHRALDVLSNHRKYPVRANAALAATELYGAVQQDADVFLQLALLHESELDKMQRCSFRVARLARLVANSSDDCALMRSVRDQVMELSAEDAFNPLRVHANVLYGDELMAHARWSEAQDAFELVVKDASKLKKNMRTFATPLKDGLGGRVSVLSDRSTDQRDRVFCSIKIGQCLIYRGKAAEAKKWLFDAEKKLAELDIASPSYLLMLHRCALLAQLISSSS